MGEELGPEEVCAGCVVLSTTPDGQRVALVIKRLHGYEVPKVRHAFAIRLLQCGVWGWVFGTLCYAFVVS